MHMHTHINSLTRTLLPLLNTGDVVRVLQATNDEWLEGVIGDLQGIFPMNFVDAVDPPPEHVRLCP